MFIGEYNHSVDAKGRVSLPARFRDDLSETFYITRGMENCLFIYDRSEWEKMDERIRSLRLTAKAARGFSRLFYAGAMEVSCDRQGRFLIPPHLRTFAAIDKEVVIIGVSNRIEVWDKEKWNEYLASDSMDYDDLTETLEEEGVEL
ncbi:MAG: division/cell wall cluster transcriptional repressor MraZ [Peptoniphilaceae bacterium]|nr:division/cell wall cluster transcriptional repressor MraZ [Peptoniphilaceae bacterium]MCI6659450.1 division/cell wall cluster transcriptional repressor MraZ [Peptoniphilaceae bacterium]MDD7433630.1 division/cell wall cluster transcriptional repressor MraZ [Peptoniphilaceae bacterium]MDY3076095.1 division/cell wall cluster transcriptional repressor MraZ [Peptoniphilaceae bacterium]MDY3987509.1 division/cell wall cluster transcriptional repressor MraZ [Peptoniphilaceae bacterium]